MLERGLSLNNQLLTCVRIRNAITGIEMHVVHWPELTTLLVLPLRCLFEDARLSRWKLKFLALNL